MFEVAAGVMARKENPITSIELARLADVASSYVRKLGPALKEAFPKLFPKSVLDRVLAAAPAAKAKGDGQPIAPSRYAALAGVGTRELRKILPDLPEKIARLIKPVRPKRPAVTKAMVVAAADRIQQAIKSGKLRPRQALPVEMLIRDYGLSKRTLPQLFEELLARPGCWVERGSGTNARWYVHRNPSVTVN